MNTKKERALWLIPLVGIALVTCGHHLAAASSDESDRDAVELVRVRSQFEQLIDQNDLVVAYVYRLIPEPAGILVHSNRWHEVNLFVKVLGEIAGDEAYASFVQCMGANLERGDLGELARIYRLSAADQLLFFNKGRLAFRQELGAYGEPRVMIEKFFRDSKIDDFAHAARQAEMRLEEAEQKRADKADALARQRRREARRKRVNSSVGFTIGGPGYYAGPGYWGWGGWGYPSWYSYNQPAVGFGFSVGL